MIIAKIIQLKLLVNQDFLFVMFDQKININSKNRKHFIENLSQTAIIAAIITKIRSKLLKDIIIFVGPLNFQLNFFPTIVILNVLKIISFPMFFIFNFLCLNQIIFDLIQIRFQKVSQNDYACFKTFIIQNF